jgi:hypothetical protein
MVTVCVTVNWSPIADNVAVDESNVVNVNVPDDDALNTPIFAIVTGKESLAFVVNVFVSV